MNASVIVVVTDLIFSTKILSTARAVGIEAVVARSLERLAERMQSAPGAAVWVDLGATEVGPIEAIQQAAATEPRPRILAYVSHVEAELADAARRAGADEVLPRSAFSARLPQLLEAMRSDAPSSQSAS